MGRAKDKPLVTFALLSYNQERFIKEAVEGAFAQTYSPLEIIISDDCSPDRTFSIISEMADAYQGPHSVILNRNSKNVGIGANINRVMELARGELIVGAAGDDISIPERVEKIYQAYESSTACAKSIFSNHHVMNASGQLQGVGFSRPKKRAELSLDVLIKETFRLSGFCHAWTWDIFDVFGPMTTPLMREDMVIPFRSALLGRIEYIHEPLVMFRVHDNNTSFVTNTMNVKKLIKHKTLLMCDNKPIYENWLKDLETMSEIAPERETEIGCLRNTVLRKLSSAKDDIYIADSNNSWLKRVIRQGKKILKGDLRGIRRNIGVFLIPTLYVIYWNLKNRIKYHKYRKVI
jgi:glycosyltransferase involved in cell wall biosynthesis